MAPVAPVPGDSGVSGCAVPGETWCVFIPGVGAQAGQPFKLHQPQSKVSVLAGQTLTLNCTTSGVGSPGAVRWLKGWDSGNKTIYDQRNEPQPQPRVMRAVVGSNTDFTIHIRDVQPEDMGTYYCVKFRKGILGVEEVFQRGSGTEVSVQGEWGSWSSSWWEPTQPSPGAGQSVPFTCTTQGFFPEKIGVKWLKDKYTELAAQTPQVTEWRAKSYNMTSTVMVTLQKTDVRSEVPCGQQSQGHQALPLFPVPPSVEVRAELSPVDVNETVTFTCHVKEFYPANVAVSWLENRKEIKVENKNGSLVTCRVVHDGQAPVNDSAILWISNPAQGELSDLFIGVSDNLLIYIVVGVVCTVLALLVAAILYLIRTKQIKGKGAQCVVGRLHEPEKSSDAMTQESDPNNLTYADLNFDKERKTIRRMVEMSQQSEYACIQTNQAPNSDDNLTYADLDMVHLSKAPKRPAPRPEEAGSEYASVQIPRK
uniref:Ig-like domain-containing protein n=1 Tax=Malurus cyaneus samueli TaxID=2593467 RepID=A0A8C5U3N7_9PASS